MLYYLAQVLMPYAGPLNVFTYHTVRAGGAALTGFLFCLLVGPVLIRVLHKMKVGQFIKRDHVADLHALHEGKAVRNPYLAPTPQRQYYHKLSQSHSFGEVAYNLD